MYIARLPPDKEVVVSALTKYVTEISDLTLAEAREVATQKVQDDPSLVSGSVANIYIRSSDSNFAAEVGADGYPGANEGLILQAKNTEVEAAVSPLARLPRKGSVVVIEGEIPLSPEAAQEFASSEALVIRLYGADGLATTQSGVSALRRLSEASLQDVGILNLLPTKSGEAEAWGFHAEKASRYVTSQRRLATELKALGLSAVSPKPDEGVGTFLSRAADGKKHLIIVGESGGAGTVRVPGSEVMVSPKDLARLPAELSVQSLVCDSADMTAGRAGFGVIGEVKGNQARRVIRATLERQLRETANTHVGLPVGRKTGLTVLAAIGLAGTFSWGENSQDEDESSGGCTITTSGQRPMPLIFFLLVSSALGLARGLSKQTPDNCG